MSFPTPYLISICTCMSNFIRIFKGCNKNETSKRGLIRDNTGRWIGNYPFNDQCLRYSIMYERLPIYNDLNGDSLPKCRIVLALFKPQSKRAVRQAGNEENRPSRQRSESVSNTDKEIYPTDRHRRQ